MEPEWILTFLAGMLVFIVLIIILFYVYISFAFMAIGRKAKHPNPALAWIPLVGPALITSKVANMHWWPILLMIGSFIPFIGFLFSLAFTVFFTIWLWKTYEAIKKPGWWAIIPLIIGLVGFGLAYFGEEGIISLIGGIIEILGLIIYLVLIGIAAWSKD